MTIFPLPAMRFKKLYFNKVPRLCILIRSMYYLRDEQDSTELTLSQLECETSLKPLLGRSCSVWSVQSSGKST